MYSELSKSEKILQRQNVWEKKKYLEKNIGLSIHTKKQRNVFKWLWFILGSPEKELKRAKDAENNRVRNQGEKQNNREVLPKPNSEFPTPNFTSSYSYKRILPN